MRKMNLPLPAILFFLVTLFLLSWHSERTQLQNKKMILQQEIKKLRDQSTPEFGYEKELLVGSPDRDQMFEVRRAYTKINLLADKETDLLESLTVITRGLQAENLIVRHTTEDFVRHLLTRWVDQPVSHWHRSLEVDEFFKTYKQSNSQTLEKFLKVYKDGPESQYLTQL